MIDFGTVTREFRSLVGRRQELTTLLGSVFAGMGIVLQNALQGNMPAALEGVGRHVFVFYALLVLVPSLTIALRMARLHGGMVIQGMLYARLMQGQVFGRAGSVEGAARHNPGGVSFFQFLVADGLAGFSAGVLALALEVPAAYAAVAGTVVFVAWVGLYLRFHHSAVALALARIAAEERGAFDRDDWEGHVSASLEDANNGLIANLGFVALMVFSVFEVVSGLGRFEASSDGPEGLRQYGTGAYLLLMLAVCMAGLVVAVRLRLAVGRFSLELDPTDRPFRPFVLTDSLLGYLLLAFFTGVAVHLGLSAFAPGLWVGWVLAVGLLTVALAVLAEQSALVLAGRARR